MTHADLKSDLAASDYAQILAALPELYLLQDLAALPATMLRIVGELIPNVFCSYNELTPDPRNVVVVCRPDFWRDRMAPLMAAANEHLGEHPLFQNMNPTREGAPQSISDFLTKEAWLENAFARAMPLGILDTMMFRLNSSRASIIFVCVNRETWGFSARERAMADLLRSHFTAAYDNAVAFTQSQALALVGRPNGDTSAAGVVAIDERGQILHINEPAVRMIRKYFKPGSWERTLPSAVQSWLSRDGSIGLPVSTLEEVSGENRLSIRWSQQRGGSRVLLLEEHAVKTSADVPSAGLSRREAEVLHWVAEGKTNLEIGKILSISVRTVEKHVEAVYRKLGVENRMGAVLRVLSQGGRGSRAVRDGAS